MGQIAIIGVVVGAGHGVGSPVGGTIGQFVGDEDCGIWTEGGPCANKVENASVRVRRKIDVPGAGFLGIRQVG